MLVTMQHIRNYGEVYHPDTFKDGTLLGFRIRVVNWIRWKLEVYVQKLVLRAQMRDKGVPKPRRRDIMKQFYLDCEAERLVTERGSPDFVPVDEVPAHISVGGRSDRYAKGRQCTALAAAKAEADGVPLPQQRDLTRPRPIDDMAQRYGSPPRQRRYARGHQPMFGHPEGDFEPVPAEVVAAQQPRLTENGHGEQLPHDNAHEDQNGGLRTGDSSGHGGPLRPEPRLPDRPRSRT